jgi:hypothetical protein
VPDRGQARDALGKRRYELLVLYEFGDEFEQFDGLAAFGIGAEGSPSKTVSVGRN